MNCSRWCGQRGRGARPSGCLRCDSHQVLLLERLLRGEKKVTDKKDTVKKISVLNMYTSVNCVEY